MIKNSNMKLNKLRYIIYSVGLAAIVSTPGCLKDFNNPNAATEEQIFSSAKGLTGAAVGLQRVYTQSDR